MVLVEDCPGWSEVSIVGMSCRALAFARYRGNGYFSEEMFQCEILAKRRVSNYGLTVQCSDC